MAEICGLTEKYVDLTASRCSDDVTIPCSVHMTTIVVVEYDQAPPRHIKYDAHLGSLVQMHILPDAPSPDEHPPNTEYPVVALLEQHKRNTPSTSTAYIYILPKKQNLVVHPTPCISR